MPEAASLLTKEARYRPLVERWRAFWNLEEVGRPLWLFATLPGITPARLGKRPLAVFLKDREVQLKDQLAMLRWRESCGFEDDFIPHLQPQQGITVFASAFGCAVDYDHDFPWAAALITAADPPDRVYELPGPRCDDGQLGEMLEFTDYFVRETGGRYPIAVTDMQGPVDTAALIWDANAFMLAMYDHPRQVHHLMRRVTDLIIAFVNKQRSRCPEFIPCHYPAVYLPDGMGLALSEDFLAVLNAELYHDFALPYVNELAEEFGGVLIHSCGNFTHQLENLRQVTRLRGVDFGASETPFEAVWQALGGKTAVITHLGLNKEIHFPTALNYVESVLRARTHNRGLCFLVDVPKLGVVPDLDFDRSLIAGVAALVKKYS
jgi:hypothetical protein